jgi:hypothetical protein
VKILTYKRTHTGDPNAEGAFGINDCMGRVRSYAYDAVIGVGGIGAEPSGHKIDGKITWVGVYPSKTNGGWRAGPIVTFVRFILFDANGPELNAIAPALAKRVYWGKVRNILTGYSSLEQSEAERIVKWVMDATTGVVGAQVKLHEGVHVKCICKRSKKKRCDTESDA